MSCQCNNNFADLANYNKASAPIFQNRMQTQPVKTMTPAYGTVGYSPSMSKFSSISAYPSLDVAYNNQPQQPSSAGYAVTNSKIYSNLASAYNEVQLFNTPYSARQSLSSPSIYGPK
jgi:hypothetical protein